MEDYFSYVLTKFIPLNAIYLGLVERAVKKLEFSLKLFHYFSLEISKLIACQCQTYFKLFHVLFIIERETKAKQKKG